MADSDIRAEVEEGNRQAARESAENDDAQAVAVADRVIFVSADHAPESYFESRQRGPRPPWKQTELDVMRMYPSYDAQRSFLGGEAVSFGMKGSSRPDCYSHGYSVEAKNYDLSTAARRASLIHVTLRQIKLREANLPAGTIQTVIIDIRGQKISDEVLLAMQNTILQKSGTGVYIKFLR